MRSPWISIAKKSIIISIKTNEEVPMSNLISAAYKNTFNFFQAVSISYENGTGENLLRALKIGSYFALIASLYVGVRYVCSLVGRASQSDSSKPKDEQIDDIIGNKSGKIIGEQKEGVPKFSNSSVVVYVPQSNSSNPKNERIDDTRGGTSAESIDEQIEEVPDIDEQLEEFFKSSKRTQKSFVINNNRVGIIFNPTREKVEIGLCSADKHLIVASLRPIPDAVWEIIENKAPANQKTSTNLHSSCGRVFKDLGFN